MVMAGDDHLQITFQDPMPSHTLFIYFFNEYITVTYLDRRE